MIANLILDVRSILPVFEFLGYLFKTISNITGSLEYEILMYQNFSSY